MEPLLVLTIFEKLPLEDQKAYLLVCKRGNGMVTKCRAQLDFIRVLVSTHFFFRNETK